MISCVNRFVYKVNANDAADASGEILVNHFLLCVEELMEISKGNKNFMCHVLLALPTYYAEQGLWNGAVSICLSMGPISCCCRFAAIGLMGRRYCSSGGRMWTVQRCQRP